MPNLPLPEGVETKDLHCVMLDVPTFDIREAVGELWDDLDLYYGEPDGPLKYAQGAVGEDSAHVTVLFGIHPSDTFEYEVNVWEKLEHWDPPQILIRDIGLFPSRVEGEDYVVLYAEVVPSAELLIARKRLEELPYTDTFPEYKPHITLAYVRTDTGAEIDQWVEKLREAFAHTIIPASEVSINLGLDD